MDEKPVRAIVIGGGITGLAAAHRLQNRLKIFGRPIEIRLYEAGPRVGGVIQTVRRDDALIEAGPDCFLSQKSRGMGLCTELGIARELIETLPDHRRSFIVYKGKLVPVPPGLYLIAPTQWDALLFSRLLSWKGKFRAFREYFVPLKPQEDETLGSFVRRRFGPEMLERIAQPMVAGIYAADPEKLSLRATFPQFLEMEKKGGVLRNIGKTKAASQAAGPRYSLFVTPRDGMQRILDRLAESLPGIIETKVAAQALQFVSGERPIWRVGLSNGETVEAEAVCVALPAHAAARLIAGVDADAGRLLSEIHYHDSLTAHFAFRTAQIRHPLNGVGLVVPDVEKKLMGACTFVHRKFPGRVPEGTALLRVFAGGPTLGAFWDRTDEDLGRKLLEELRALLGIQGAPLFSSIHRWRKAMPQYALGHLDRIKAIDGRVYQWPGLALAGSWRHGIGVPDCIESGESAADALVLRLCNN